MATEKQEQKYERILDAALHIFAQKGFHDAKVSEIAKHAGCGGRHHLSVFQEQGRAPDLVV